MLPNKAGRNIPVTSANAFGRVLSDIDMTIDNKSGDVVSISANNVVVDRTNAAITPNAAIKGIVDQYNTLVSPIAGQVIGSITADATNIANAAGEMDAGDLIADAQLAATQPVQFGGAQIAFMNAGGVRNPGFLFSQISGGEAAGDVTYGEAFTVQPFGNSLVTMTLTGQQIKDVLEQQFPGCMGQTVKRIMQVSNGFSYSWSDSAPACGKISDISLNGAPIDLAANYRVTVNNFMSTGGDGFGVFVGGTSPLGGAQDIDALVAYMANFKLPNPAYNPADVGLHKPRITKLP
jgi:5'-nucleotidase